MFFFVFNAKATTAIYTYAHTLSRHDALPIWARWRSPGKPSRPSALLRSRKLDARRGLQPAPGHRPEAHCLAERKQGRRVGFAADEWRRRAGQRCIQGDGRKLAAQQCLLAMRSEEHTSELQSLMRISYAV